MIKDILHKLKYKIVNTNKREIISRIISSNKKVRVLFYVSENQKWGYQSLYEELDKNPQFEPIVVVSLLTSVHEGIDKTRNNLEENFLFFKSRGMNVEYGYKDGQYIDLKTFEPDIVFYEQPWSLPKKNSPYNVSKYALTCHCPYSITTNSSIIAAHPKFYEYIWKYFVAADSLKNEYYTAYKYNYDSIVVSGHPKLDLINESKSRDTKHYVIYAPHHAIRGSHLKYGTFEWNGHFMLEYAKAHPELNWVFKPHPNIKYWFQHISYMTEKEIDNYYKEWEKIALVYDKGDYFELFNNSDAMITDCGSFLIEYFMTGKPLIHLVSNDSVQQTSLNNLCSANYYKVFNVESLKTYLDEILIKKNDFLKESRDKKVNELFENKTSSAKRIVDYLSKELGLK